MTTNVLIDNLDQIISLWIKEFEQYSFIQLCIKPSPDSWSLGQVGMHLISATRFHLEQIKICVANNEHAAEEASPEARAMFLNNEFPDALIEGPRSNRSTPQPENKEQLVGYLINLKKEINDIGKLISKSQFNGKTRHPGLKYFSATEWLQFAEMHFRHHWRQKKRIDGFLKLNNPIDE